MLAALQEHFRTTDCDLLSTLEWREIGKAQGVPRQRFKEVEDSLVKYGWLKPSVGGWVYLREAEYHVRFRPIRVRFGGNRTGVRVRFVRCVYRHQDNRTHPGRQAPMIEGDPNDRARLATQNRPRDAQAIRAAIHELHGQGLGDYAIAGATGLSVEHVRRILSEHHSQEVE
jgi:hypothetical protein